MEFIGYIAIICVGIVLGSIGAGGSMLTIPVLVYMFSIDMETASAYSLFLVGATSLTGAVLKQQRQPVSVRTAILFAIPSLTASFVSRKWIIVLIPKVIWSSSSVVLTKDDLLMIVFTLLMMSSSVTLLRRNRSQLAPAKAPRPVLLMPLGFMTGLIAGLVGAGGGFLILPALIIFAGLSFSAATATSLMIIASNSLLGFCGDLLNRPIDWRFLLSLTTLAIFGLLLGYWSNRKSPPQYSAQRGFAWFAMLIVLSIWVREIVVS